MFRMATKVMMASLVMAAVTEPSSAATITIDTGFGVGVSLANGESISIYALRENTIKLKRSGTNLEVYAEGGKSAEMRNLNFNKSDNWGIHADEICIAGNKADNNRHAILVSYDGQTIAVISGGSSDVETNIAKTKGFLIPNSPEKCGPILFDDNELRNDVNYSIHYQLHIDGITAKFTKIGEDLAKENN